MILASAFQNQRPKDRANPTGPQHECLKLNVKANVAIEGLNRIFMDLFMGFKITLYRQLTRTCPDLQPNQLFIKACPCLPLLHWFVPFALVFLMFVIFPFFVFLSFLISVLWLLSWGVFRLLRLFWDGVFILDRSRGLRLRTCSRRCHNLTRRLVFGPVFALTGAVAVEDFLAAATSLCLLEVGTARCTRSKVATLFRRISGSFIHAWQACIHRLAARA
mmetsp:Transcript_2427/g.6526  ORF Transcript_2427/g.6526 Transcript_2427/m.6526 type:complete len:219 (+) Transcript_2427:496-1152(+)